MLQIMDYTDKDSEIAGTPDPLIVGSSASVYEHGEQPDRLFARL